MNPLDELKQKLMVKPTVEERERVAVVIKGEKTNIKPKVAKKKPPTKEVEEGEEPEEEAVNDETERKMLVTIGKFPIIVDETQNGFDRMTLLKKLKESKMSKVTIKPVLEKPQEKEVEPVPLPTPVKKAKKIEVARPLLIEPEEGLEESSEEFILPPKKKVAFAEEQDIPEEVIPEQVITVKVPEKKQRITKKPEKGIAILGPETIVKIGDTDITKRLPKKTPPILIKVSNYYMNNREIFINFINSLFEPYRIELQNDTEGISCDNIGKTNTDFSLLTHQKIVRDYMNLYTPYRGLLLYHGLGSGKTCTSIAIAEGMKESKCVIIMTPASLQANYREELKKCGDLLYKKNQYWEWIDTREHPEALDPISAILNLPREYIQRHSGAWFVNIKKKSNYDVLSDAQKKTLEEQLNEMIRQKYRFINYNGLRSQRLDEMTSGYTKNIFDNSVVVIDEAHNFISRIVNKLKKEKPVSGEEKKKKKKEADETKEEDKSKEDIFGEDVPLNLATKLYYMLLKAQNARVILLSGTPVINYPNEFAILFNILRGYIKTWKIPLNVQTSKKIDKQALQEILIGIKALDYLDYSPSSKILTITKNPFGFRNKVGRETGYQGVQTNYINNSDFNPSIMDTTENKKKADCKNQQLKAINDSEYIFSDDDFERKIISTLRRNDVEVIPEGIQVKNMKALPDTLELFEGQYIDFETKKIKNVDSLKRRILGLSSYFRSAQENLLPRYNKQLGVDYHIIRIPMSDYQFKIYESARNEERKSEKSKKKETMGDLLKESTSTYRIFSRLFCNFVMPERPIPERKAKKEGEEKEGEEQEGNLASLLKDAERSAAKQDLTNAQEGEVEGDEILDEIGGIDYKIRLDRAIQNIVDNSNDFLTPEALQTYSPKFLNILENIKDPDYQGLHLVYSQFRTAEGIGLLCKVLDKNGFARFKIKKNTSGIWEVDIREVDEGKPTYALYTGTETTEEKEIVRHIYNGEWDQIPDSISNELKRKYRNNNMGEVIKVFMITSSGSEGINLKNTRYVHIMEPYWHPVRLEQVIGRARRICSHKDLPKALQTVEVFVYLMIFSPEQLKSDEAIELKRKDLSKAIPKLPQTSDQYLYEISEIKANLTGQLTDAIKESSIDCYIYSNGKCVNFGDPTNNKFSYVPDYAEQQNDTTVQANQELVKWAGKTIELNGVTYVYRRINENLLNIYDLASYEAARKDAKNVPLQIGTLSTNERGEQIFEQLVTK
jgi:hypothetical protein